MIGIYSITNKITGVRYIGESSDIEARWNVHYNDLKNNRHHNYHLQNSWNKCGEHAFKFEVLEWMPFTSIDYKNHKNIITTLLLMREYYYMLKFTKLYNLEKTLKAVLKNEKEIDGFDKEYVKTHTELLKTNLNISDFKKLIPEEKQKRENKKRRRKHSAGEYAAKIDDDEEIIDYSF